MRTRRPACRLGPARGGPRRARIRAPRSGSPPLDGQSRRSRHHRAERDSERQGVLGPAIPPDRHGDPNGSWQRVLILAVPALLPRAGGVEVCELQPVNRWIAEDQVSLAEWIAVRQEALAKVTRTPISKQGGAASAAPPRGSL